MRGTRVSARLTTDEVWKDDRPVIWWEELIRCEEAEKEAVVLCTFKLPTAALNLKNVNLVWFV